MSSDKILNMSAVSLFIITPNWKQTKHSPTGECMAQMVKSLPAIQETQVQSLGCEDPLEKTMATNPLQYSCLQNPMDRGAWQATVHGVAKESDTTEAT